MPTPSYTPRLQQVLALATKKASEWGHTYVGTGHLLAGLAKLGQSPGPDALRKLGVDLSAVDAAVKDAMAADEERSAKATSRDPWPDPPAAPARSPDSFHHYVAVDVGTQWMTRLIRTDPEHAETKAANEKERQRKDGGRGWRYVHVVEGLDVPASVGGAFLSNVFSRQEVSPGLRFDGNLWGAWSISPAEYQRIAEMVRLYPSVQEYNRLAAYPS